MCVPVYVKKKKERRLRSIIVSSVIFMTQLFTEFITNELKLCKMDFYQSSFC